MDLIIRDAYVIQYGAPSITYGYYIQKLLLSTKPAQDNYLNITCADGADPYIQVPKVDCAYGVDE